MIPQINAFPIPYQVIKTDTMNKTQQNPVYIVVTGGAGYIGSHTCKALSAAGYTPVVVDNLVSGHKDAVRWGPFEQGDVHDQGFLRQVFKTYNPIAVIHFAAFIEVGESVSNPAKYFENNVGGSLALLSAMTECGIKNIVFSSTCAVYGEPQTVPIQETNPRHPLNPYGKTKFMVELMLEDFSKAYGMNYVALRYFNACGADPSAEIGERHDPETHLIPRALMAAAGKAEGLHLFGDDYDTPDGTCVRDYIHVNDLAQAHIKGVEYLSGGGKSVCLNLGTGQGTSVKQVIAAVENVTGKTLDVTIHPRREGDSPILVAQPLKVQETLGFSTQWNDVGQIVASAWAFHKKDWDEN